MDKSKGRGGNKGSKSHLPFHGSGDLIALGSKSSGGTGGTRPDPTSGSSSSRGLSSSSSSKPIGTSSVKRESSSSILSVAPPSKKSRPLVSTSTSTSTSTSVGGASSSSKPHLSKSSSSLSKDKSLKKDPLEISAEINPGDLSATNFFSILEKADKSGQFENAQGLIIGGIRKLKGTKDLDELQLCNNLLLAAKNYPLVFQSVSVQDAMFSLVYSNKKAGGIESKVKTTGGTPPYAQVGLTMFALSHSEAARWPTSLIQLWMEDCSGERNWVDLPHFKPIVDTLITSFGTQLPPSTLLPPSDGGIGGGSSPLINPYGDDPSFQEDLKDLMQDYEIEDLPLHNRYVNQESLLEGLIMDFAVDAIHKKAPEIPKNLLKSLSMACGLSAVRGYIVGRIEQWLHNGKSGRYAQELLLHLCVNANCNTTVDAEVVTQISKLRLKTKPLIHFYSVALREMVRDNETNLRHVLNQIIYNELSPQRSPNNMPLLGAIISGAKKSRSVLADIFIELLQKREDFHPALRLLLREIVRAARFEVDLSKFIKGLMKARDIVWLPDCKERAFIAITDLILLSMFMSVSPQVREASAVAAVRVESKDTTTLNSFRKLVSGMQQEAISWMYTVVPKQFSPSKKEFLVALNKIFLKDPINELVAKDGWPPESEKNLFFRLCLEIVPQENSIVYTLMMGLSKEHAVNPAEALDLVEQAICRSSLHKSVIPFQKLELIELLFRITEYRHPENISLPSGYEPPKLTISKFYWRVWILLCIICAQNPTTFGQAGWTDYPILKVCMEMCMTNHFSFPTASSTESSDEIIARELQTAAMEKEEILEFETHLAASSSKTPINERNSLLISQLMRMDPFGSPRTPPGSVLAQLQSWNEQMNLGHQLCRSRNPDFLLDLIQRNSEPMPWLSRLVSEGSFEILPVQCLCEFMMGHMDSLSKALTLEQRMTAEENAHPENSPRKQFKSSVEISKEDAKLLQLLHHLQQIVQSSVANTEAKEVVEYFFRRLSSPKSQNRAQALQALQMLLSSSSSHSSTEGRDGEEHWLLDCLPTVPIFSEVQGSLLRLIRQAIQVENEPIWVTRYLEFLSTWLHLSDDCDIEGLALDVAQLVVERNVLMSTMTSKHIKCFDSLFDIFCNHMKKVREPHKETYSWSETLDQVLVQWSSEGLEATMNILVIHAIVLLLSSYSAHLLAASSEKGRSNSSSSGSSSKSKDLKYNELLDIWFPKAEEALPKGFLLNTSEEVCFYPDWIKLRMIRSNNSRLVSAALQGLDIDHLILFVQHFGVPVQSMTAMLYCLDTVTEQTEDLVAAAVVNAPYMHLFIRLQWKRGASGGEKFVALLKSRCGVEEEMEVCEVAEQSSTSRPVLHLPSIKEKRKESPLGAKTSGGGTLRTITHRIESSPLKFNKLELNSNNKDIQTMTKELLRLTAPLTNRRRSSAPPLQGEELHASFRRHSAHFGSSGAVEDVGEDQADNYEASSKVLGKLVDTIVDIEPCIVRNALEFQLPLLFGRNESQSNCRSYLMTSLVHQAGWETIQRCLNLFLATFDSSYDPTSILDLIHATHSNPKLWQGVDKYVPKHQPNLSVLQLTGSQLLVMAEYIVEEIGQVEMKSTKFSISNLLGPTIHPAPQKNLKTSKKGIQDRVRLWLQCCQQQKGLIDGVIVSLVNKKGRIPCTKRFICQVYVEFPEVILVENWKWKADELSLTDDDISSVLDTISHGLVTAIANPQPGKDWAKKAARDYEICLRKLASLHPTLLIRQLQLMGTLLEGRVHLEGLAFHQQNHNIPFVVYLSLFELMQPHILKHFKTLQPAFLLYIKFFKNYGVQKDYSSSLSRFSVLLHNLLVNSPQEVKEFLSPHYTTMREFSTVKYYVDLAPLQNLIGSLVPPSGSGPPVTPSAVTGASNLTGNIELNSYMVHTISSLNDRLVHASNHDEMVPVLQELDTLSTRNPGVLNQFYQNLNPLMHSENDSCRTLAFNLALKHATYSPGASKFYVESILQLIEEENSHLRDILIDKIHEFVILAQESGEEILKRLFHMGVSSNVDFITPITKSMALLRNYSSLLS